MKFLTKEHWSKLNAEQTINKGICFENLVKKLLIAEFGKAVFQGTRDSWDGSKDFFLIHSKRNIGQNVKIMLLI